MSWFLQFKEFFAFKFLRRKRSLGDYSRIPKFLLQVLCVSKDKEIESQGELLQDLVSVIFSMMEDMESLRFSGEDSPESYENKRLEASSEQVESLLHQTQLEVTSLRDMISSLEESKNNEIEKLVGENHWLRGRLEEKLRLSQSRGEIIEGLKREIAQLASEAEIGERRRLCYEYKIKTLEEKLEKQPEKTV